MTRRKTLLLAGSGMATLAALAITGWYVLSGSAQTSATSGADTQMERLWLEAQRATPESATQAWQAVQHYAQGGKPLPDGTSPDVLTLNLVASQMASGEYDAAMGALDQLTNQQHALLVHLAVLRHRALRAPTQAPALQQQMLSLRETASQQFSGEAHDHWLNALATALMDTTPSGTQPNAHIGVILREQKTGRHRAYLLHRLALLEVMTDERKVTPLREQPVKDALEEQQYALAYRLLATSALSRKSQTRWKWLIALHEAVREDETYADLALMALWLIERDTQQNEALVDYIAWLSARGRMDEALRVSGGLRDGRVLQRAYSLLSRGYERTGMSEKAIEYEQMASQTPATGSAVDQPSFEEPQPHDDQTLDAEKLLYDVPAQSERLRSGKLARTSAYCAAQSAQAGEPGEPLEGFQSTSGYGADRRAQQFSWYLMVHSARALAGEGVSQSAVRKTLLEWAGAQAFHQTEETHNALFPLKRLMLPTIMAAATLWPEMTEGERGQFIAWMTPLAERIDMHFGGKVDVNNHRYMTDAALMAWGVLAGKPEAYYHGVERFHAALAQMRPDGALPLEVVRGGRSVWYMRQSLASLSAIAEIARLQGEDLYGLEMGGKRFSQMLSYFMNTAANPLIALPDAAQNYTPGHDYNVFRIDLGMLQPRGHGRHYMAFAEPWLAMAAQRYGGEEDEPFTIRRLRLFMERHVTGERPFIDEFSGGNISCFKGTD